MSETFAVGDVVEANYRGQGHWYPGRVASFDSGSYEIAYDDGESESNVSLANVRRASSAEDDDAAVSDGIEEMSEADETDSDSDEYVPSLEESEDIFAPRAPCARSTRPAGQKAKYSI